MRPRKDRQTQVDGRRVERVDGIGEVQPQILPNIELPGPDDLGEFGMDAPVAPFVGIGERRAPHRFAEAHAIELGGLHRQTSLDVAQALPIGELREGHRPIVLGTGQGSHPLIAA